MGSPEKLRKGPRGSAELTGFAPWYGRLDAHLVESGIVEEIVSRLQGLDPGCPAAAIVISTAIFGGRIHPG